MTDYTHTQRQRQRGMSFIEMLGTIAAIAILATIGARMMTQLPEKAEEQKLNVHVNTLNASVKSYMASGGSLEGLTSAQQVVDKLKTMASNAEKIPGFGGSFLDPSTVRRKFAIRMG